MGNLLIDCTEMIAAGTCFGPYRISAPLAAGGMGVVYRARDTRLERDVAVKLLAPHRSLDGRSLARFEQEARVLAALSHPNLLSIHDVGNVDGTVFVVTELLEGATLRDRLSTAEIGVARAVEWALQIAQGLAAAHERSIVHRDLKPENVFITRDGIVKILDFGLARRVERDRVADAKPAPTLTEDGAILGTVGYLAPEQARGLPADHRSDIFAFGAVFYEMLTGRRAFQLPTAAETLTSVLRDEPVPIAECGRKVPSEVDEIVGHCLEKDPTERFRSARDLVFALRLAERALARPRAAAETAVRSIPNSEPAHKSPDPSLAVLPFRTVGGGAESEYFSEGMTEDIIAALSRIPGLHVAARTSSFAFRGKDDDVRRIGRELGVATVLDGSVRQVGQRLRVTAQLIDVGSGYNLWSERWDRELADVFAVQDEIARAIAATFRSRLPGTSGLFSGSNPDVAPKWAPPRTPDVAAYDHYLKGRYFWNRRRLHESIDELEAAVDGDPEFDVAYTALSEAWAVYGFYGGIRTWECWARARAAAESAEELAPDTSSVLLCLGVLEYYYGWNSARAERYFRLAIERDPANGEAYFWLALCVGACGRVDEGLAIAREGVRLEPHSPNNRAACGWPLIMTGRYEEAAVELAAATALGDSPFALWSYGITLSAIGHHADAIATHRSAVEVTGGRYSHYIALLAGALALGDRIDEARSLLAELDARAAREYVPPLDRAIVLTSLGDDERALDALEQAHEQRNAFLWARIHFPYLRRLASTPRFRALAARLARRAPVAVNA
jgi:serine/threonine protein kinase/tetratricopeptide (TPR) repeat protein